MASSAQSPLRERPIQFGKYTLLARIASGGMGELYLAQLRSAGGFAKLVVIKRILSHLTDKQEFVDMFVAEARTAARISHPNVCQIYELGQVDGRFYMALEYLEGLPLAEVMVARKRAPQLADLRFIVSLVSQTAEGLHHAHSLRDPDGEDAHVVHRDVNPRNVFVTSAGVAKVLDFGIVKVRGALSQVTTDSVRGTYSYMAPEQLQGESVESTADIFSLGTMTWEAVVGRRLFKRSSDLLTWRAIVEEPIPRPKQFRPDLSPELDDAIMRALCRPVAERFQSAREFATALEQAIHPLGAPFTTLAVAAEMEKAFTTELAEQRERVFAAHRREQPAMQSLPEPSQPPVPAESVDENSGPIEDWFGLGSDTRVADAGYAELVARMAKARSQEIPIPTEVADPPSEEIVLSELPLPDLMPLQPALTGATTADWRPVTLPRPSQLPVPAPIPAYVQDLMPESAATTPNPVVSIADDDDSAPIRLRPRRRWLMAVALAVSAATGAALVLFFNRGARDEIVVEEPAPAAMAGSVVAGSTPATEASAAAAEAAVAEATAPTPAAGAATADDAAEKAEREAAAKAEREAAEKAEREAAEKQAREAAALERAAERARERDRARDLGREKREKRDAAKRDRRIDKAAAARGEKTQKQRATDRPRQRTPLAEVLPPVTPATGANKDGGFLTINTEPYATVYVDGKKRGFTPVVRLALPPGAHNLRLVSSAGQPDKKMRVRIVAGQELRKFVKW